MFGTLKTLIRGANARAEDRVRESFSVELIDQKIRDAGDGLKAAKATLASLIQRQRAEERQIAALETRIADLLARGRQALTAGRDGVVGQVLATAGDQVQAGAALIVLEDG